MRERDREVRQVATTGLLVTSLSYISMLDIDWHIYKARQKLGFDLLLTLVLVFSFLAQIRSG